MKFSLVFISYFFIVACTTTKTIRKVSPYAPAPGMSPEVAAENPPPPPPAGEEIKWTLVLGPGGAKSFAHVAALQELQKLKVKVDRVVGIEWGSLMAALYSRKGSAGEVEWNLLKFKFDNIEKYSSLDKVQSQLSKIFVGSRSDLGQIPFVCPALNLQKNQLFWMNRGEFSSLLPFCISYPPIFKSYRGNVAGVRETAALIQHLRATGSQRILFINVLGKPAPQTNWAGEQGTADSILWNEISYELDRIGTMVDAVVQIPTEEYSLLDFSKHNQIMQTSVKKAETSFKPFSIKWRYE